MARYKRGDNIQYIYNEVRYISEIQSVYIDRDSRKTEEESTYLMKVPLNEDGASRYALITDSQIEQRVNTKITGDETNEAVKEESTTETRRKPRKEPVYWIPKSENLFVADEQSYNSRTVPSNYTTYIESESTSIMGADPIPAMAASSHMSELSENYSDVIRRMDEVRTIQRETDMRRLRELRELEAKQKAVFSKYQTKEKKQIKNEEGIMGKVKSSANRFDSMPSQPIRLAIPRSYTPTITTGQGGTQIFEVNSTDRSVPVMPENPQQQDDSPYAELLNLRTIEWARENLSITPITYQPSSAVDFFIVHLAAFRAIASAAHYGRDNPHGLRVRPCRNLDGSIYFRDERGIRWINQHTDGFSALATGSLNLSNCVFEDTINQKWMTVDNYFTECKGMKIDARGNKIKKKLRYKYEKMPEIKSEKECNGKQYIA